jgi:murein L,D-transpeptidase YafK
MRALCIPLLALAAWTLVACVPAEISPVAVPQPSAETTPTVIDEEIADYVIVRKSERVVHLMRRGKVLRSFPIALGWEPLGHKYAAGDGRTPEGIYVIDGRNERSRFHRSLHLSYPGPEDILRSRALGLDPGGDIVIHGMPLEYGRHDPVSFFRDWTDGCIAVGNLAIEEIWARVPDGTLVDITP